MSCLARIASSIRDIKNLTLSSVGNVASGFRASSSKDMIFVAACALVLMLIDVYQMLFMTLGAVFYAMILMSTQRIQTVTKKREGGDTSLRSATDDASVAGRPFFPLRQRSTQHFPRDTGASPSLRGSSGGIGGTRPRPRTEHIGQQHPCSLLAKKAWRKQREAAPTSVAPPTPTPTSSGGGTTPGESCLARRFEFVAANWDGEVAELLTQIAPKQEHFEKVQHLAARVQRMARHVFPTARVDGYAWGQLSRRQAFSVAVPDVEIIVVVDKDRLSEWHKGPSSDSLTMRKSALRLLSELLVSQNVGFRFRRSAYRCVDPKVTLLANREDDATCNPEAIAMDFSVNCVLPGYSASLLAEAGRFEPCAHALFWLVRLWAKYRGICHASQGHLAPYVWSLLVVYFLQARAVDDGAASVPPLAAFNVPAELSPPAPMRGVTDVAAVQTAAALFKAFLRFYATEFDWKEEVVSIRTGRRHTSAAGLQRVFGMHVEDPRDQLADLGGSMNTDSGVRLREELARASEIVAREGSLTELLEIWAPQDDDQQESPCA